jgi:hypothetical protein
MFNARLTDARNQKTNITPEHEPTKSADLRVDVELVDVVLVDVVLVDVVLLVYLGEARAIRAKRLRNTSSGKKLFFESRP